MKVTLKRKTWVLIGLIMFILGVIGIYLCIQHYHRDKSDELVRKIIDANPLGDNLVYVYPEGYGYSDAALNSNSSTERVISYVKQMMEEYPNHIWTRNNSLYTLAQLYRKAGRWEEALQLFKRVAKGPTHHKHMAEEWVRILDQQGAEGEIPSITGKVWIGDQLADHVLVYLKDKDASFGYSTAIGNYTTTVTNGQGEFQFYNIAPKSYYVGVGIEAHRLDGYVMTEDPEPYVTVIEGETTNFDVHFKKKMTVLSPVNGEVIRGDTIHFRWEPYPDAVSYKITIDDVFMTEDGEIQRSSGGTIQLSDEWKEPEAEYSIDELRQKFMGFASYGEDGLNPDSILGLVYPGGQFTWSVAAYNEASILINKSDGIYMTMNHAIPFFSLDKAGQLQGDKYVLNQDYEQAIVKYQEEMTNPYALRALALIYYLNGIDPNSQGNPVEALKYMKMIKNPSTWDLQFMEELKDRNNRGEASE